MKEIKIVYNNFSRQYILTDPHSEKFRKLFLSIPDIIKYFNFDSEGEKIRKRHNLHVQVEVYGNDSSIKTSLEEKLSKINWNKAQINYFLYN
jgi:hypothetical protein